MAGVNLCKHEVGSRKRIAQIRWKRWEILHAAILCLAMTVFSLWVGFWIATHHFD